MGRRSLADSRWPHRLSDGQHLALLVAKEINFSRRHPFQLLVLLAVVAYVVLRYSNVVMFPLALAYMFSGIWARAAIWLVEAAAQKAARSTCCLAGGSRAGLIQTVVELQKQAKGCLCTRLPLPVPRALWAAS